MDLRGVDDRRVSFAVRGSDIANIGGRRIRVVGVAPALMGV